MGGQSRHPSTSSLRIGDRMRCMSRLPQLWREKQESQEEREEGEEKKEKGNTEEEEEEVQRIRPCQKSPQRRRSA